MNTTNLVDSALLYHLLVFYSRGKVRDGSQ
nr:MAG TPA: hypothetical protein [Caudoviricetes sp.]